MTQATPTQRGAVLSIPAPAAYEKLTVDMVPGNGVRLPFNPGETTVSRSGNDLVFELDNGGTVTINKFFVPEDGEGLPTLILPQGEEVPAALAFADTALDLSTASGPDAASAESSGSGEYADNAGSLIDGVERLGSLGAIYWDRNTEVTENYMSAALGPTAGPETPEPGPAPLPGPPSGPFDYVARGVMYPGNPMARAETGQLQAGPQENVELRVDLLSNGGKGAYPEGQAPGSVGLSFFGADGEPISAPLEWSYDQESGEITFNGCPPDGVYYVLVTDSSGNSYYMQIVVDSNGDFDSKAQDAETPPYGGGLAHGEWHSGNSAPLDGKHDVTSSNLDDEMTFASGIYGAAIKTGHAADSAWGDDTITVRGDVTNSGIDFGNGAGKLTVNGTVGAQDGDTAITMADGTIGINAVSNNGAAAGIRAMGSTRAQTGATSVDIETKGAVDIEANGVTSAIGIEAGCAEVNVKAGGIDIRAGLSHASGAAFGVKADASTLNLESQKNLIIDATGAGSASYGTGIQAAGKSTVNLTAGGTLDIDAAGGSRATGITASGGSTVNMDAETLDISALNSDFGKGIAVSGNSTVNITAHDVTIKTDGDSVGSNGLRNEGGEINIHSTGGTVTFEAGGSAGWHAGMLAQGGRHSVNRIDGAKEVVIRSDNSVSDGMSVNGGSNIIDGSKVDGDSVHILGTGSGMYATGNHGGGRSLNHILNVDHVRLGSEDKRVADGMVANIEGENLIENARDVEIRATASGMNSSVYAGGKYAGFNHIKGDGTTDVAIDVAAKAGQANTYGMINNLNSFAWSNRNEISGADEVVISAAGAKGNYGMYSGGGDGNYITAHSVTLDVSGDGNNTAMHAIEGGTNAITADSVTIDAGGGTAMYAHSNRLDHFPSTNTITGSDIGITGDIIALRNTAQSGNIADSTNQIHGTDKGDSVTVTGDMKGWHYSNETGDHYGNTIDTGKGNDTVTVNGDVNGTHIDTGAGNDQVAVNGTAADSYIGLDSGNDTLSLNGFTGGLLNGGAGDDSLVLNLDGLGGADAFEAGGTFGGLFAEGAVKGFDEILLDMTGGSADALALDDLLDGFRTISNGEDLVVRITGDVGDQVDVRSLIDGGWSFSDNGDGTSSWTNPNEAALTFVIQNGL